MCNNFADQKVCKIIPGPHRELRYTHKMLTGMNKQMRWFMFARQTTCLTVILLLISGCSAKGINP